MNHCLLIALLLSTGAAPDREPGRRVKVAAVCMGMCRADQTPKQYEARLRAASEHLAAAAEQGVDIACLPEDFASKDAQPVPGPTTRAVAQVARKHKMYVICNVRELADGKRYNTAVLLDRQGKVVGKYRKVYPWFGERSVPGREGLPVFDTDFGKVAVITCFDSNFPELWNEADIKGAEIVFWQSGGGGGVWANAYATLHNYYVVAVGGGQIVDKTGKNRNDVARLTPGLFVATLDLDRTFAHGNFNDAKIRLMLEEHKGDVELERRYADENWYLLRSIKPGVRVRDLFKQYGIETLRAYRNRSRRAIEEARQAGKEM